MREIALDTETTGLDPNSGDRLVEIGCVEMIDHIRTGRIYHTYINPERNMPIEAERIHGLTTDFLKDKPIFRDVVDEFLEFISDSTLVIHNAAFDMKFINHELKLIGRKEIPMIQTVDTVVIARKKFPGQPANLDSLCRRFNIDLSARTKHGALLDAELLADVYLELNGGRQASMDLCIADEKRKNKVVVSGSNNDIVQKATNIKARYFPATEEELTLHEKFLEQIKNPIWKHIYSQ